MKRTDQQNESLHVFCEQLAETLNDSGLEMKAVLSVKEIDVPWNKDTVKEVLWKPIQKAKTGKKSTTELSRVEPSEVHAILMRHLGEKLGVPYIPWPSEENRGS